VKSRLLTFAVVIGGLGLAGSLLNRVAAPAWAEMRAQQPALKLDSAMTATGQGVTLALLGGFRALVADGTWIRMYDVWEERELPVVDTLIRLVTAIDPRPLYFWINGARIIAHDFANWRVADAGGHEVVATAVQRQIDAEQGRLALRHLEAAAAFHPASAELWIERAGIELVRLGDPAAAAESYRRACEQPHAPYFAARLHAELLRRLGRKAEALDWYVKLHPGLPAGDEGAGRDVVLARIRDLEEELQIAAERRYQPPSGQP
jgi:tetratricopeptide (TPR) repeat protein